MVTAKPTLVLIHGGWHTPSTYYKFTDALNAAGYEVHVPLLPSMNGARPPNTDLTTDTALVRGYVESLIDTGRTVVAILHSYGGQVGTNALYGLGIESRSKQNLSGGVARLIYICGFALTEGLCMNDKVKEFGHEHFMPIAFDFADDDSCVHRDPKTLLIGPGAEHEELEEYVASLVRWNGRCVFQPVEKCAWREISVNYVYTMEDMTAPIEYQRSMVEGMRGEGREVEVVELATGHIPNLTMTKELVDVIYQAVIGKAK